jgi:putative membrane protein
MKSIKARDFFTAAEHENIRAAVEAAEATTSGEIATIVVDRSDSYREAETLGTVFVAGLLGVIVCVAIQHVAIWTYIPLVFLLFLPLRLLFHRFSRLKLPFIGKRRLEEAVRERALRAFYEKGLYRTREETGILIFISLLEHKVWILGDRGINVKIPPDSWQRMVRELAEGIKGEKACEALCSVIAACGAELARHFPRRADDKNELTDEVLE